MSQAVLETRPARSELVRLKHTLNRDDHAFAGGRPPTDDEREALQGMISAAVADLNPKMEQRDQAGQVYQMTLAIAQRAYGDDIDPSRPDTCEKAAQRASAADNQHARAPLVRSLPHAL